MLCNWFVPSDILLVNDNELNLKYTKFDGLFPLFLSSGFLELLLILSDQNSPNFCILDASLVGKIHTEVI